MKKVILVLAGATLALAICLCQVSIKLIQADRYINRLEQDYPDYIDTSAESDEYTNYYNNY
jgi:hypothetical protein